MEEISLKKLFYFSILFLFFLAVNVLKAGAFPDIHGEYSGTYTTVVSNCMGSDSNGTYNATLAIRIPTQSGNTFSGSATGNFGYGLIEYIQLSGTITESGQISGNTLHTFVDSGGEGTFTGQLSGNTLSIENPGYDVYGDTCTYTRSMSATRVGGIAPSADFSATPMNGNPPLSVNFSDESTGTITSWNWNFGDGASSTIQNPSHIYTDEGKHSVSLTVSGPYGSDTAIKTDYISIEKIATLTEYKLLPTDGADYKWFGYSVSLSGNYAIVGAAADYENGGNSGSAYIFARSGSSWNQVAKLTAGGGAAGDYFGNSVSISGDYAIVGAYYDDDNGTDSGSAYVFEKSGSSWNQMAKLTAGDGAAGDWFGSSVSFSGDYAIVGAAGDDDNGDRSGSAYIFARSGSSWTQVAKLTAHDGAAIDFFGDSVSISGDYAIVGASRNNDNGIASGSVYVFARSVSSWDYVAKLTASDRAAGDLFGHSVSLSGDYAIVGALDDDDNWNRSGSAYVFEKSGSSWNQVAKLTASDGAALDWFGYSVSLSGDYAIVGALNDDDTGTDSGSAYVFEKSGSSWNQVAKLTASNGAAGGYFGYSVSLSGNNAIVGAYRSGPISGSAHVFNLFPSNDLIHAIIALQVATAEDPTNISNLEDVNSDGLIGLEEAIFALQSAAELR